MSVSKDLKERLRNCRGSLRLLLDEALACIETLEAETAALRASAVAEPAPAAPVPASVREALEAINAAHAAMFAQCCSNPITNAWGKKVDVSALNEAHRLAEIALASLPAPEAAPTREDLLQRARQFIADSGCDEDDSEVNAARNELLAEIDSTVALKAAPHQSNGGCG